MTEDVLIIDVPKDFVKGDWKNCNFGVIDHIKSSDVSLRVEKEACLLLDGRFCTGENCPLSYRRC